ncbi:MAG TPA: Gfo/Idh/MocA family oxidoreductase [Edaphocola sp.]|nr:Gfo/Idh/MocA family oxidoreductase [Edaphocola sp.]
MINFAIVGLGNIGKRHAGHILNNRGARLAAVCDIDPRVQQHLPGATPFYTSLENMLARPDIDVVNICTPNYLHAPHTLSALYAGYHAVVEKPMALSTEECDLMIAAGRDTGKMIFAVKQNRYNPPVQAVKQLIDEQRLGKIFMIQVNCFWNRSAAYYAGSPWRGKKATDGGCLFTQFSHFVDILYYLNGDISSVSGMIDNFSHQDNTEFEDSGVFCMKAKNGALINFTFSTCAFQKNMEGSITILAEKGTVKIGGQYLNTIDYQCIQDMELPQINISAKENDYGLYKGSMSNHDQVVQNVIDVLENKAKMMTTAGDGRQVVGIIERMYAHAQG